jgi:GNAT superfamily N-acetyltransferase
MISEDADQIASIHTKSWQHAYRGIVNQDFLDAISIQQRTESWRKGIISNEPPIFRVVVESSGKILGFCCGLENRAPSLAASCDCELWAIYVDSNCSRKGIGSALLNRYISEMKFLKKNRLCIWVLRDNLPARQFYENRGGLTIGISRDIIIGRQALQEVAYEFNL